MTAGMIIVTHKETCKVVTEGPTYVRDPEQWGGTKHTTVCTCGGEYLKIERLLKYDRTRWTALVSSVCGRGGIMTDARMINGEVVKYSQWLIRLAKVGHSHMAVPWLDIIEGRSADCPTHLCQLPELMALPVKRCSSQRCGAFAMADQVNYMARCL